MLRWWDWKWPLRMRIRPWWWILLKRAPPEVALVINVVVVLLLLGANLSIWILFALGLPFSAHRTWKAWRRAHPGRRSWRPPSD